MGNNRLRDLTASQRSVLTFFKKKGPGVAATTNEVCKAVDFTRATVRKGIRRLMDMGIVSGQFNELGEEIFYLGSSTSVSQTTPVESVEEDLTEGMFKERFYFIHAIPYRGQKALGELNLEVKVEGSITSIVDIRKVEDYILWLLTEDHSKFNLNSPPNHVIVRDWREFRTMYSKSKGVLRVKEVTAEKESA